MQDLQEEEMLNNQEECYPHNTMNSQIKYSEVIIQDMDQWMKDQHLKIISFQGIRS